MQLLKFESPSGKPIYINAFHIRSLQLSSPDNTFIMLGSDLPDGDGSGLIVKGDVKQLVKYIEEETNPLRFVAHPANHNNPILVPGPTNQGDPISVTYSS